MQVENIKLLHVTTVPQTLWFLKGQVGFMKSKGIQVHATSSPGDQLEKFSEEEQVYGHAVDMPRRITPFRDLFALRQLRQVIAKVRPHIIHAHTPKGGMLGMIAARMANTPVCIYHIHGLPCVTATGAKRVLLRVCEKVSCGLADSVLCVSPSLRDVVLSDGLCKSEKVKVPGGGSINGVDSENKFNPGLFEAAGKETRAEFGIPPESRVLGFVGRVVRDKGIIELMQAWNRLRQEYPDLYLVVVGGLEPQDPVPSDIEQTLCNDPRIIFTGFTLDVSRFYATMDVMALPSYREGFGVVAIEAASMKIPVVATRITGCVDAVCDGVNGMLVQPRDADALTNALRLYLDDSELRVSHGQAGREWVMENFRREVVWEAVYDEYERLLSQKRIRAGESTNNYEVNPVNRV